MTEPDDMDDTDDAELLANIAAGDTTALTQLFARYRPRLWRYLWRQLDGDTALAEDTLQEVFVAVWRSIPVAQTMASLPSG